MGQLIFVLNKTDSNENKIEGVSIRLVKVGAQRRSDRQLLDAPVIASSLTDASGRATVVFEPRSYDGAVAVLAVLSTGKREQLIYKARFSDLQRVPDKIEFPEQNNPVLHDTDKDDIIQDNPKPDRPNLRDPDVRPKPEGDRPIPKQPLNIDLGDTFASADTHRHRLQKSISEKTKSQVGQRLERRNRARSLAQKSLGQHPAKQLRGTHFVPHDANPDQALKAAREDGLRRLQATSHRKGITLRQSDGLKEGPLRGAKLQELLNELIPGQSIARRDPFEDECKRRVMSDRELEDVQDVEGSHDNTPSSIRTDGADFDRMLANILSDYGAPSELASRADTSAVAGNLQNDLSSGPADTPAYYDYPVLHIAWKDTWQAVLDGNLKSDIADLYYQMVDVVPSEYLGKPEDVAEVNELQDLLVHLSGVTSAVANVSAPPPNLVDWELDGLADKWSYLSSDDQYRISLLKEIQDYCDRNWYGPSEYTKQKDMSAAEKKEEVENHRHYLWQDSRTVNGVPDWDDAETYGYYEEVDYRSVASRVRYTRYLLRTRTYLSDVPEFNGVDHKYLLSDSIYSIYEDDLAKVAAQAILDDTVIGEGPAQVDSLGRAEDLINTLQRQSDRPYQFDVFVPDSYNFGLVTTYRQKWTPLAYQAGDLAGTLPLAPQETRSFTIRRSTKSESSRSSFDLATSGMTSSQDSTSRVEGEISRRMESDLKAGVDLKAQAQGGFLGNGGSFAATGNLGTDLGNDSNQIKKDMRETTRRIAQDYRDERKLEISLSSSTEDEYSETRTISNPNNELTVTYLFYELQRRFEVSERLQDLSPAIMVAFRVPSPDAISEAWLLAHDWILKDVLLDQQFRPVLAMLSKTFTGDEVAVEILEEQWKTQINIVSELRAQFKSHTALRDHARRALEQAASDMAALPDFDGNKKKVGAQLSAYLLGEQSEEDAARQALDWADVDLLKAESTLREGIGALERATEAYTNAVRKRLDQRTQIDHLILHIRQNIMHYMQQIWLREHPDQRYLRLYDLKIDWPGGAQGRIQPLKTKSPLSTDLGSGAPQAVGKLELEVSEFSETRWLHEVADLSRILGFRGNYAVFRLKENNAFSAYMMQDYLDDYFGLSDPDGSGEIPTAEEAIQIARCRWRKPGITDAEKGEISDWLVDALDAAQAVSQMVVVPTGELFIEALPGSHPILEDFKLQHRAYDMQRAGADARIQEIEMLRRAMRLSQGDATDPDIDKHIQIDGAAPQISIEE